MDCKLCCIYPAQKPFIYYFNFFKDGRALYKAAYKVEETLEKLVYILL